MRYLKITNDQRAVRNWRTKRNRLLAKIKREDRYISSQDALWLANRQAGPMPQRREP